MQPIMVITATLTADGKIGINVQGSASENELLVHGMLEKIRQVVQQGFAKALAEKTEEKPTLLLARGSLPKNGSA
jgi:hypothetical protein